MLLLDSLLGYETGRATSRICISPDSSFFIPGKGVPAYIAIEYLAQTIAAISGMEALEAGTATPIGYLLGTRKFQCNVAWFEDGCELQAEATEDYLDGQGMGAYLGKVTGNGVEASCRLTVFRPDQAG